MRIVVVNPRAGGGRAGRWLPALREQLAREDPDAECVVAGSIEQARARLAACPPGSRVVVCGGDGTVHQLLPALLAGQHELGLVPAGSGDDLARALGLHGQPWTSALHLALFGSASPVDLGEVRLGQASHPFISSACVGFDAEVAVRALALPAWLRGLPRYLVATLSTLVTLRTPTLLVSVDGERVHDGPTLLASTLNTPTYGGGMPMAPPARIDDGVLDVVIAGGFSRLGALNMLPRVLSGRHLALAGVSHRRGRRLEISGSTPLQVALDGEPVPAGPRLAIEALPGRLAVVRMETPRGPDGPLGTA